MPCILIYSDYQREEKFLYCLNRSSRFVWKAGMFIPNQTASQYSWSYTWNIFLALNNVCLLELAVPLTHKPHSLPSTCYIHVQNGREKLKEQVLVPSTY